MNKEFYISAEKVYGANKIAYTYIDENGEKQKRLNKTFEPTLHTLSKYSEHASCCGLEPKISSSKFKDIHSHLMVQQKYSMAEYSGAMSAIRNNVLELTHYHGNIDVATQFMYQRFHDQCEPDLSLIRTGFIDIEVYAMNGFPLPQYANDPIVSISLMDSKTLTLYAWGLYDYDKSKNCILPPDADIIYIKCHDEKALLESFLTVYRNLDFDNITGWYTNSFDLPYLYNRLKRLFGKKTGNKLSPFNCVSYKPDNTYNDTKFPVKITGVANLDYLMLYKKYMYGSRESYTLGFIADLELGSTKLDYSEYNNLNELYNNNHQKFIEYNLYDTYLVYLMDKKLGLLDLAMTLAYTAGCNFNAIFSPVKTWDIYIYNELRKRNIIIPPRRHIDENADTSYAGAFVRDPVKGLHDWIVTYDLNSLYPMIQRGLNISPETLLDRNTDVQAVEHGLDTIFFDDATVFDTDAIQSANGWRFDKHKVGFIPKMLEKLGDTRVEVKNEMLEVKQNFIDCETEINRRKLKI